MSGFRRGFLNNPKNAGKSPIKEKKDDPKAGRMMTEEEFERMSRLAINKYFRKYIAKMRREKQPIDCVTSRNFVKLEIMKDKQFVRIIQEISINSTYEVILNKVFFECALEQLDEEKGVGIRKDEAEMKSRKEYEKLCYEVVSESVTNVMNKTSFIDADTKSKICVEIDYHRKIGQILTELHKNEKNLFILEGFAAKLTWEAYKKETIRTKNEFVILCERVMKECVNKATKNLKLVQGRYDEEMIGNATLTIMTTHKYILTFLEAFKKHPEYRGIQSEIMERHIKNAVENLNKTNNTEKKQTGNMEVGAENLSNGEFSIFSAEIVEEMDRLAFGNGEKFMPAYLPKSHPNVENCGPIKKEWNRNSTLPENAADKLRRGFRKGFQNETPFFGKNRHPVMEKTENDEDIMSEKEFEKLCRESIMTILRKYMDELKRDEKSFSYETSRYYLAMHLCGNTNYSRLTNELNEDILFQLLFDKLFHECSLIILDESSPMKCQIEKQSRDDYTQLSQEIVSEVIMLVKMTSSNLYNRKTKMVIEYELTRHEEYELIGPKKEEDVKSQVIVAGTIANIIWDHYVKDITMSKKDFEATAIKSIKGCISRTKENLKQTEDRSVDEKRIMQLFLDEMNSEEEIKLANAIRKNPEYIEIYKNLLTKHVRELTDERINKSRKDENVSVVENNNPKKLQDKKGLEQVLDGVGIEVLAELNQEVMSLDTDLILEAENSSVSESFFSISKESEKKEDIDEKLEVGGCEEIDQESLKKLEKQLIEEREKCESLKKEKEDLEIKLKTTEETMKQAETKMAENLRIEKERLRKSNEEKKKWEKCEQDLKKEKEKCESLKKEKMNLEKKLEKAEKTTAENVKKEKETSKKLIADLKAEKENSRCISENLEIGRSKIENMEKEIQNYDDSLKWYKMEQEKSDQLIENLQEKRENEKKEHEQLVSKISAMEEFQKINNKETEEWKAEIMKMFEKQSEELRMAKQELKKYQSKK